MPEEQQLVGRVQLARAWAHLRRGELQESEGILQRGGGLVVPDIREGENSVTELWYSLQKAKAGEAGVLFDADTVRPQKVFDFRMTMPRTE